MAKYKVEHDRPGCIGCGACAALAPELWEMNADGKSDLKNSKKKEENGETVLETKDIEEKNFEKHKEAASACPVNVIHIIEKETGKKII
jgi:ferredoxin